jgi:tRNA-2-methylthio-N6-dimethylallyladenosine synthase
MQIAVGGCMAQMDKDAVLEKAPWVDVVFGTHNMGSLPSCSNVRVTTARPSSRSSRRSRSSLHPADQARLVYSGWVSISVGCNNTCTFCIVPSLRGKEKDRRPATS